ncbi:hypothetical protein CALCODRAFT_494670 [Calocera cornea HHB12733]|uniref:Uncharacterized protein n=1 Tax=Calocera cornea HHB12733 TaxID=1353952 RepID=A0A165GWG5_9BASI|nr:hypothetical protein CALCODRAFT_494670 [Calocera cornea HHB12733]
MKLSVEKLSLAIAASSECLDRLRRSNEHSPVSASQTTSREPPVSPGENPYSQHRPNKRESPKKRPRSDDDPTSIEVSPPRRRRGPVDEAVP